MINKTLATIFWILASVASVKMVFFTGPTLEAIIAVLITLIPALLISTYSWISKKRSRQKTQKN